MNNRRKHDTTGALLILLLAVAACKPPPETVRDTSVPQIYLPPTSGPSETGDPLIIDISYQPTRAPLFMCRKPHVKASSQPADSLIDLGEGMTVHAREDMDRLPPRHFHLTYRNDGTTLEIYADGTIDVTIAESAISRPRFRYYVPPTDVARLAEDLRRLEIWKPKPRIEVPDAYTPQIDLIMDSRRGTSIQVGTPWRPGQYRDEADILVSKIADTARLSRLWNDLGLRLRLLEAAGFRFDSPEGADLALALALREGYSDAKLEPLLAYNIPCAGGLYEALSYMPRNDLAAWTLQDALIKNGHQALADRLGPVPPIR